MPRRPLSDASPSARVVNEELDGWVTGNRRLLKQNTELQQGIDKAQQGANKALEDASSMKLKLRRTETAYEEAKKHFIMAPDLVPCLRSLTDEVKAMHEDIQANLEKTTEWMAKRPAEGRRSERTLQQIKRVLHNIERYPQRRRRARAADAADDGGSAIKRGRICYICRCKGHLAQDCPQARTDAVESADPTISDAHQRTEGSQEANVDSTGWSIFSVFRRTFTSGID